MENMLLMFSWLLPLKIFFLLPSITSFFFAILSEARAFLIHLICDVIYMLNFMPHSIDVSKGDM